MGLQRGAKRRSATARRAHFGVAKRLGRDWLIYRVIELPYVKITRFYASRPCGPFFHGNLIQLIVFRAQIRGPMANFVGSTTEVRVLKNLSPLVAPRLGGHHLLQGPLRQGIRHPAAHCGVEHGAVRQLLWGAAGLGKSVQFVSK